MSDAINVIYGEMEHAKEAIRTHVLRITQALADLESQLKGVQWSSESSAAYRAHQDAANAALAKLNSVFERAGVTVGQSSENYRMADQRSAQNWSVA